MQILETGKTGYRRFNRSVMRGFTLLELLVVMLIVAFTALVVVVNGPSSQSSGKKAADDFALSLKLADDVATLSNQPVRLVLEEDRYYFERYVGAEWQPTALGAFPPVYIIPPQITINFAAKTIVEDNEKRLLRRAVEDEKKKDEERDDIEREYAVIDPTGLPVIVQVDFLQRGRRWSVTRNDKGEVSTYVGRY